MDFSKYPELPGETQILYHGTPACLKDIDTLDPNLCRTHYGESGKYVFATPIIEWACAYGLKSFSPRKGIRFIDITKPEHGVIVVMEKNVSSDMILDGKTCVAKVSPVSFRSSLPYSELSKQEDLSEEELREIREQYLTLEAISESPVKIEQFEIFKNSELLRQGGVHVLLVPPGILKGQTPPDWNEIQHKIKTKEIEWLNRDRSEFKDVPIPLVVCNEFGFNNIPIRRVGKAGGVFPAYIC